MKTIYYYLLVVCLTAIAGCGGGGGDGREARNVSGVWIGALIKNSDQCSAQSPSTINLTHEISQNEDAVVLISEAGYSFLGNTVGENGFSVEGSHPTVGSGSCTDNSTIEYESINDDSDSTADIELTINRTCTGMALCSIKYTGTISRSSNVIPTIRPPEDGSPITPSATISPSVTITPNLITGGCASINPNPAADVYSGDGGCGLSEVAYRIQDGVVVLNSFGANGATSFSIDSNNSSSARAGNSDLTIQQESGYVCSMVCSPPSTFTVQCFKEGGSTCIEKF